MEMILQSPTYGRYGQNGSCLNSSIVCFDLSFHFSPTERLDSPDVNVNNKL